MKALTYTLSLLLTASILSGCAQEQYAQQEYDDMYYTAQDRQKAIEEEQAREQAQLEARRQRELEIQKERELAEAERRKSAYDKNDVQTAREINPDASTGYNYEDEYYEEEGYADAPRAARTSAERPVVYNNYYYNSGAAFNNPWRYDPYWNSYAGMGWNSGFSFNIGWNSWNNWCDPFWDPYWCGTGFYYDAYRPAWAWNGWGYHNSYARGYRDGFYDAHWRRNYWGAYYPGTVIVYNGDNTNSSRRNVRYGPRSSRTMAVADLGVGERASSRRNLEEERRARSLDSEGRRVRSEGSRSVGDRSERPAYPTERGNRRDERTSPSSRPRAPRSEPSRSNEARPRVEPAERTRPSRPAPNERPSRPAPSARPSRPAPSNDGGYRPSSPSRGNDGGSSRPSRDNGGSAPSRSRDRGGDAPLQSNLDGNRNQEPAQAPARQGWNEREETPSYQDRQLAQPAERSYRRPQADREQQPAERPARPSYGDGAAYQPNTYSRPQPQQRSVEERSYSRPAESNRSVQQESYTSPQPQRSYAPRPAPQERSAPASFSRPSNSSPAISSPAISSPARSSSPSRSRDNAPENNRPSRSRGGN